MDNLNGDIKVEAGLGLWADVLFVLFVLLRIVASYDYMSNKVGVL
jgi:hypothetical protein